MRYRFLTVFFLLQLVQSSSFSQAEKFAEPGNFNDLHTLYTYQKSNWDGTHASLIFLYVKDTNQLESFKWSKGDEWATLVGAQFNWKTYSVARLENIRVFKNADKKRIASLEVNSDKKLSFEVGDYKDSMTLDEKLWHSYDFDFASLGFSWRALKNKQSSFSFLIADAFFRDNKIGFENKGIVQVNFDGKEKMNDKECMKYKIDGPGLQNKGGHIWINSQSFMIEQYRISLPDEEGFVNGQLKLQKTEKISPAEWEKFMQDKMREE